jgi:hypothetical protein
MNLFDLIDPPTLTGFARQALRDLDENEFSLSPYFPARQTVDTMVTYGSGQAGLARTAKFRSYDAEAPIGKREGIERQSIEIPPISEKLWLTEYERYRLMNNSDAAVADVYNDVRNVMSAIQARIEVARGRALVDGSLSFNENGLVLNVNFGRDASLEATAAVDWSVPTTDILGDWNTWIEAYVDINGFRPGGAITSSKVWGEMLANDDFRDLAFWGNNTSPTRLSDRELQGLMSDRNLPPIIVNDSKVDIDGTPTRIIDQDTVVFVPPNTGAAGATVFGTTLEAIENLQLRGSEAPGVVAVLMRQEDPISYWTLGAAKVLPILGNPDLTAAFGTNAP